MAEVKSIEDLRRILPPPNPATEKKIQDHLDEQAIAFIKGSPFLLFATANAEGAPDVSPKGDEPGFVKVEDKHTLLYPERDGNNLAFGLQNILANPNVSLIFMIPGTGETLRVAGRASLVDDAGTLDRLRSRGKPAKLAARIRVERAYFHCARSLLRAKLWTQETWPKAQKISFGKVIAPKLGQGEAMARQIDAFVEDGYKTGL